MFDKKYPSIHELLSNFTTVSKVKFLTNIETIIPDKSNILFINDYVLTSKIDHHYLNPDIPITRNSNTFLIRNNYASYIYYLTRYLLIGSNHNECYTYGEFFVHIQDMYDLILELEGMIDCIVHNNMEEPLNELKQIFNDLINESFDPIKYLYLMPKNIEYAFRYEEEQVNTNSRSSSRSSSSSRSDTKLEEINDNYTEHCNKEIYGFKEAYDAADVISDNTSTISSLSNEFISNIRDNLVNILESKN